MKSPIILEGEPFDWEYASVAASHVVDEDGHVNWRAAMAADPGVMRCPGCEEWLWKEGRQVRCPDCGEEFDVPIHAGEGGGNGSG